MILSAVGLPVRQCEMRLHITRKTTGFTLGGGPRGPSILRMRQCRIVAEQTPSSLVPTLFHQRPRILARLTNLDNLVQLSFSDLRHGQVQFPPLADLFGLFQTGNLLFSLGQEVGVASCGSGVLPRLLLALPLFFGFRISPSLGSIELGKEPTGGSFHLATVFIGRVVEAGRGLLLERNVGVVICWKGPA